MAILDLTKEVEKIKGNDPVRNSIERQVAAKCAANVLQGNNPTPETITLYFEHFLKLIRGDYNEKENKARKIREVVAG